MGHSVERVVPYESFETYYVHRFGSHDRPPALPLSIHPRNGGYIDNWLVCPWGEFVDPVLSTDFVGDGAQSLKMSYHLPEDSSQTNFSRVYENPNLDWTGCNAVRFWLKPDASARTFKFMILPQYRTERFTLGTPSKEFYFCGIPLDGVQPVTVTMPFACFEGPSTLTGGPVNETAFWIMEGRAGIGAIYIDKIEAVQVTGEPRVTVELLSAAPRIARTEAVRINCGCAEDLDAPGGMRWIADRDYYRAGDSRYFGDAAVAGCAAPALFCSQRVGADGYECAVDNGRWRVRIHCAEMDIRCNAAGRRVFAVNINGVKQGTIDPFMHGGGMAVATAHEYEVNITGGALRVDFEPVAGVPSVAALEIEPLT